MRRDRPSKYLGRLITAAQRLKGRWPRKPGDWTPLDLIGDPDLRLLSPDTDPEGNAALREAFKAFDLDPSELENWRLLLALFAEAYFAPRRRRGGVKLWDEARLFQLLVDFEAVKKNPQETDEEICGRIKQKFGRRYARVSAVTIRRKLQDARNPVTNSILGDIRKAAPPTLPRGMTAEDWCARVIKKVGERWKSR